MCVFWVTTSRLDNVTDDHCHSRLRSRRFFQSRSGILLTVCFDRKRALLTMWLIETGLRAPKSQRSLCTLQNKLKKNDTISSHWPKSAWRLRWMSATSRDIVKERVSECQVLKNPVHVVVWLCASKMPGGEPALYTHKNVADLLTHLSPQRRRRTIFSVTMYGISKNLSSSK